MKRFALILLAAAFCVTPAVAQTPSTSETPAAPRAILTTPYAATLGDMIALTMSAGMPIVKATISGVDAPVIFAYDRGSQKIVVSVYGDPVQSDIFGNSTGGPVDRAKGALEFFRSKAFPLLGSLVSQTFNVSLSESDLTLVYLNRKNSNREVIRREGNRYLVAD
jgi:hypothetical protein